MGLYIPVSLHKILRQTRRVSDADAIIKRVKITRGILTYFNHLTCRTSYQPPAAYTYARQREGETTLSLSLAIQS